MDSEKRKNDTEYDEEYKKALEKLNCKKSLKTKEEKASSGTEFSKLPLGEKIKKDPIILISFLLVILVIAGAILYFLLPSISLKTMDFTMTDFKTNYESKSLYTDLLAEYSLGIPEITYSDDVSLSIGNETNSNIKYFSCPIQHQNVGIPVTLQGSVKSSNNKVKALRVLCGYSDSDDFFAFLNILYGSYLQAIYPELNEGEALDISAEALSNVGSKDLPFTIRGDYGYRVIVFSNEGGSFIAFDICLASDA